MIVIYFKSPLYFHKDCGIFCEGEYQVKGDGYAIVRQRSIKSYNEANDERQHKRKDGNAINNLQLLAFGLITALGHKLASGLSMGFGRNKLIKLNTAFGHKDLIDLYNLGSSKLIVKSFDLVGLVSIVGHVNIGDISLGNLGIISLVGSSTLVDCRIFNGIGGFNSNISLVNHISIISLIGVGNLSLNRISLVSSKLVGWALFDLSLLSLQNPHL